MGLRSQLHKLEGLQSCHLPHLIELVEKCSTKTMRRAKSWGLEPPFSRDDRLKGPIVRTNVRFGP